LRTHHNYTYQAFGTLENTLEGTKNRYLFAGEQLDLNLDQYYLRQRYYSAINGNFSTQDKFEGTINHPLSLHNYQYSNRNPVLNIDPTGYFSFSVVGLLETVAIASILSGLSIFAAYVPAMYAINTPRNEAASDDVIIYVGSTSHYIMGHAAIEVDGVMYDFDGTPEITPRDVFIANEQENYQYSYQRYTIAYGAGEKQLLRNSLLTLRETDYALGRYVTGFPIVEGYAYNCTTYITDSLPSKGFVFDNLVKSQFYPYGLGWGLDSMNLWTQGREVKRLPDIDYSVS
jgi:RHS repeat-associated protein